MTQVMLMRNYCFQVFVFLFWANSAFSQTEIDASQWVQRFQEGFGYRTYIECYQKLGELRDGPLANTPDAEVAYEAKRLIGEAVRVHCEGIRLAFEQRRLERERQRLLEEAERLDAAWLSAHQTDPEKYPNTPDRDKSQRRMRADAARMFSDIFSLGQEADRLTTESARLVRVSLAVDSGVQNAILRRLLGDPPPSS